MSRKELACEERKRSISGSEKSICKSPENKLAVRELKEAFLELEHGVGQGEREGCGLRSRQEFRSCRPGQECETLFFRSLYIHL